MPDWIIWSWYTGRWWVGCYIWYSEEDTGWSHNPPMPLLAVPNVITHPSMASVPITILLYGGPLFWDFNVTIKMVIVGDLCSPWVRRYGRRRTGSSDKVSVPQRPGSRRIHTSSCWTDVAWARLVETARTGVNSSFWHSRFCGRQWWWWWWLAHLSMNLWTFAST